MFSFVKENLVCVLRDRERCSSIKVRRNIGRYLETKIAINCNSNVCYHVSPSTKSTFVITFSPDRTKMATSHGNHTIQISDCYSHKVIQVLSGHRRTPWCVRFHPVYNDLLASGCLGGEVRLWNLKNVHCDNIVYQSDSVIGSLTFHPVEDVMVICSSNKVIFFNWNAQQLVKVIQMRQLNEKIRLVRFTQNGFKLLIGVVNISDNYDETGRFHDRSTAIASPAIEITTHRLQLWNCAMTSYPNIYERNENLIVSSCKIQNDSSVAVTDDGTLIAVFVPIMQGFGFDFQVRVISLRPESYLCCVYSRSYGEHAFSISFSPFNHYLMVGVNSRNLHWSSERIVAQVLKLPEGPSVMEKDTTKHVCNVHHNCNQQQRSNVSINAICFHPEPGIGIIYGTNQGHIHHCRVATSYTGRP